MSMLVDENLDFDKLANVLFSQSGPFRVKDIVHAVGVSEDETLLKKILSSLVDNGILIQQGSAYSLKKF